MPKSYRYGYSYKTRPGEDSPHARLKEYSLDEVANHLDNARRTFGGFIITWQWVMAGGADRSNKVASKGDMIEASEEDVRYSNEVLAQLDSVVVAAKKMIEEVNGRCDR